MQEIQNDIQMEQKKMTIQGKKHISNKSEIVYSMYFFLLLFAGIIVYLVQFVKENEQDMMNNSYNSRQKILMSQNYRGTIFSQDEEILAQTILDEQQTEQRVYPYDNLFSHVVGYSSNGRMGVEALTNYYLIQSNTSISNKISNDMIGNKNPGNQVYTTLEVPLQKISDEQLNVYRGAVVISEVKTGRILAMVSHPNFNPNQINQNWESLINKESEGILLNRATQGIYPPGSTFKIITALEYIKQNPEDYMNYRFQCNGFYQQNNSKISCYHGAHHGTIGFNKSFAKSCNSSFANIGMSLDKNHFRKTLDDLLFDQELPLTLPHAPSYVHMDENNMSTDEMMQTSIGQGKTQITPIHLNMITSAIANDGLLMKPYVVDRVESVDGKLIKKFNPETYGRIMEENEAKVLTELMTDVVENGTAHKLSGLSYTAAGKTGSAEYNNEKGDSHAWFTGFAPVEDPEISITIIVEGAGNGGSYAVPIAKAILDAYFQS